MPPQIKLRDDQVADLAIIRDISPDTLNRIVNCLRDASPRPMRPDQIHREILNVIGQEKSDLANAIMRPLLGLQPVIRNNRLEIKDTLESVSVALRSTDPVWLPEQLARWEKVAPVFGDLLDSPSARLVSISLDLMYEHENLLQGTRVITDIRPVFGKDTDQIEGAVISHTLRLRYDSSEGDHSISIAMDDADIRELERQCKRAILKAQTARTLMVDKAHVPTVVAGEDSNA